MLKNWITDPSVDVKAHGLKRAISWKGTRISICGLSPDQALLQCSGDLSWAASSSASSSLSRFGQTLKRQLSWERNSSINLYTNFKAVSVSVVRHIHAPVMCGRWKRSRQSPGSHCDLQRPCSGAWNLWIWSAVTMSFKFPVLAGSKFGWERVCLSLSLSHSLRSNERASYYDLDFVSLLRLRL